MAFMLSIASITVFAASETYDTYYSFACSTTSKIHTASATPTATITTSNMVGSTSDSLWVEIDKKYVWGWASSGSGADGYTTVSSVRGSTFSLKGKGDGKYRILFMKNSCAVSGNYDLDSAVWYSDLTISYNK